MLLTPELIQQFNRLTVGGKIPNFCELPEIDQGILVELALAYDDETSQQLMLDALIRSDLLQSLISSKCLDVASKYQMIEQAVNDALKVLLQVKIDEWNAITPAKVLPLPEVRMLRCVNYETPSGQSETLIGRVTASEKNELTHADVYGRFSVIDENGVKVHYETDLHSNGNFIDSVNSGISARGDCSTGEVIITGMFCDRDPYDPRETFDPEPEPFDPMKDAGLKPSDF